MMPVVSSDPSPEAQRFGLEERAFDRVHASDDGGRFAALFGGDWDGYRSKSDADFALAVMAFRAFGEDAAKVEAYLRASNINPAKYSRRDYVTTTLRAALVRARKLGPY